MRNQDDSDLSPSGDYVSEAELRTLKRRLLLTCEIRFSCADRLTKRDAFSSWMLNILSLLVAVISTVSLIFAQQITPIQITILGTLALLLSIYIMMMNYEYASKNYGKEIYVLDHSATQIRKLYNIVRDFQSCRRSNYETIIERYNSILEQYSVVRHEIDFLYTLTKYPREREETGSKLVSVPLLVRFRYRGDTVLHAMRIALFPASALALSVVAYSSLR